MKIVCIMGMLKKKKKPENQHGKPDNLNDTRRRLATISCDKGGLGKGNKKVHWQKLLRCSSLILL
uniref:Uncharacterized protein n=1 Tax=Lepeophtheirus salmonis TaxID=72036 RepID=A0A0K2U2G4_LEPSM